MNLPPVIDESELISPPSYCSNTSDPTIGDKELEALRQQFIFWVEGYTQDESQTEWL